jgi:HSP20 family protein
MSSLTTAEKQKKAESPVKGREVTPARNDPFALNRIRDEFNRLFEMWPVQWPSAWWHTANWWRWGVEVKDQNDAIVVKAEAPGFEAGDFDIQVLDGRLTMRAERKSADNTKEGEESSEYTCYHSISLPPGIEREKVEADYRNGILTVKIPKTPEAMGRHVPVSSA